MHFSNNEGKLDLKGKGIKSFIKYISAGGGKWRLKGKDANQKTTSYSSEQRSQKVKIAIEKKQTETKLLSEEDINRIRQEFLKIETVDKFKGE